jgi:hypothetical protein
MRSHRLYVLPLLLLILSAATACTGTRSAYKAAETPDQMAYIVTEHYAALVKEAADLKDAGTLTGSALAKVQAADNAARPLVLQLGPIAQAYAATKSAESEFALQQALNKAVLAVSNLINSLKGARP